MSERDQLLDVVIVISHAEPADTDEGGHYATSRVYKGDLEGKDLNKFLTIVGELLVEFTPHAVK